MTPVGGSFRDPDSRVFVDHDTVLRGLSEAAWAGLDKAMSTDLPAAAPVLDWSPADTAAGWSRVIAPEAIPLVSQPSEWSFGMLKRAALATLDIVIHAAEHGYSVVDATAHNLTFRGTELVFFDHGSFRAEPFRRWDAYGQFCDEFLSPLLLEAHAGIRFQPYLRGRLAGLPITELAPLFRGTARFKPGVMAHVKLRARLESRARGMSADERRALSDQAAPGPAAVARIAGKLKDLIEGLESGADSVWADYTATCTYDQAETEGKTAFVSSAIDELRGTWAWDVGANTGHFSQLLARGFENVLAIEQDAGAVDRMLDTLGNQRRIHPIVADITDPPAARGVMLEERTDLRSRAPADFALFLAVVHHLSIGAGLPLWKVAELARWAARGAVVEFVDPSDPMVAELTASRPLASRGYDRDSFEEAFDSHFRTIRSERVTESRTLYQMEAR